MTPNLKQQGFSLSTVIIYYGRDMTRRQRKNLAASVEKQLPCTTVTASAIILDPLPVKEESYWREIVDKIYEGAVQMNVLDIKVLGAPSITEWRILQSEGRRWQIE